MCGIKLIRILNIGSSSALYVSRPLADYSSGIVMSLDLLTENTSFTRYFD